MAVAVGDSEKTQITGVWPKKTVCVSHFPRTTAKAPLEAPMRGRVEATHAAKSKCGRGGLESGEPLGQQISLTTLGRFWIVNKRPSIGQITQWSIANGK
jgi:hypothetical protein